MSARFCPCRSLPIGLLGVILITLASVMVGCPNGGGDDSCQTDPPDTNLDGGLVCGEPFELNSPNGDPGVFGVKVVEYVHVNAAGIVETDTISTLLVIAYVDFHRDTLDADVGIQLCQIQIPKVEIPGQPLPTTFRTLPAMLPNIKRVQIAGWMSGDKTCDTFESEKAITVIGACLEDELNDWLVDDPAKQCSGAFTSADKETYCDGKVDCMFDLDQDGLPGTTLEAENIPGLDVELVYGTMRSWISMDGIVANSDLILGVAHWSLEVVMAGCHLHPIGGGDLRECTESEVSIVSQINPDLTATPGQDSTFQAVRIREDMDCMELIDRELDIFGR